MIIYKMISKEKMLWSFIKFSLIIFEEMYAEVIKSLD